MQAMPSIVEADRRCHHASGDAQMGRLFPDDALVKLWAPRHQESDTMSEKIAPKDSETSPTSSIAGRDEAGSLRARSEPSRARNPIELVLDGSRIIIEPNGRVIIENLTADLLDVAAALNPDDLSLQCRIAVLHGEDGADEEPQ